MKKILVIEDDVEIQESVRDFLETEGYKVFAANDGKNGVTLAKEIAPDLIISDILMPGKNGYQVLSELSAEKTTSKIPFIFLTAKVERLDQRKGMELGADDYLTKPFQLQELLRAIETRLKKYAELNLDNAENISEKEVRHEEREHILLSVNNQPKLVKVSEIICIEADAEYSYIYLESGAKYFVRKLLKEWEDVLPSNFERIHRSTIINLKFIEKVEKWFNRSLKITLRDFPQEVIVSRRASSALKKKFG